MTYQLLFSLALFLIVSPLQASVLTLEPEADTNINNWDQDVNYGSATTLGFYGNLNVPLFRFDLTQIPATATVSKVEFHFTTLTYGNEYNVQPTKLLVYDLARDFKEYEATFKVYAAGQPWAKPGMEIFQDFFSLPYQSNPLYSSAAGEGVIDLSIYFNLLRSRGRTKMPFILYAPEFNLSGKVCSREYSEAGKRPRLVVTYSMTSPQARAISPVFLVGSGAVALDGSASSLPGGGTAGLTYAWRLAKRAPGSKLALGTVFSRSAKTTFTPDVSGYYVAELEVQNPASGESTKTEVAITTGLRLGHPRLHLNDALLAQIRALRDTGDPVWKRFAEAAANQNNYFNVSAGATMTWMLMYLINNDLTYFNWTWDRMRKVIYKNQVDRSGGLTDVLSAFSNDTHSAAYVGGPFTAELALFYDWGYAALNPTQRQDIIDWLNGANYYNNVKNGYRSTYFRNDAYGVVYGVASTAYATYGENPEAPQAFAWFRESWDQLTQAMEIFGRGGAEAEGIAYGTSVLSLVWTANIAYYAGGEDLFLSHDWFRRRLSFDAFAAYPGTYGGPKAAYPGGWPGVFVDQAYIGGDARRHGWPIVNFRPLGLPLARRFASTPEAQAWNYVYRQPEVDGMIWAGDSVVDVLFYTPRPALAKPTYTAHFDPSMGYVYLRSDWNSSDATWFGFLGGPQLDTHEHLDKGTFHIFKRRDLAPKTGHMDWGAISSDHALAYYTRTISANTILVGDPKEIFRGFHSGKGCDEKGAGYYLRTVDDRYDVCPPNEGGQRTAHPFALGPGTPEVYNVYKNAFETGKLIDYNDDGTTAVFVTDITNAYNNARYTTQGNQPKVTKVYRRLAYLRDIDTFVFGDTVVSTDAAFEKKWLLHGLDRFAISGASQQLREGETLYTSVSSAKLIVDDTQPSDKNQVTFDLRGGYSSLLIGTVFPRGYRYRLLGGRNAADTIHPDLYKTDGWNSNANHFHRHVLDFWVKDFSEGVIPNHRSANWPPEIPPEINSSAFASTYYGGYGRCRIEIEPSQPAAADYFLNILRPSLDPAAALPPLQEMESSDTFGVQFVSGPVRYQVTFSKHDAVVPVVTRSAVTPDGKIPSPPRNLRSG